MDARHLREVSEALGHKWDLVILTHLRTQALRYTELAREIRETDSDLTEGVLNKNLKRLVANGLIHKQASGGSRRAYALTSHGRRIVAILAQIAAVSREGPEPGDAGAHDPGDVESGPETEPGDGDR